jgi:hypothetical protein
VASQHGLQNTLVSGFLHTFDPQLGQVNFVLLVLGFPGAPGRGVDWRATEPKIDRFVMAVTLLVRHTN